MHDENWKEPSKCRKSFNDKWKSVQWPTIFEKNKILFKGRSQSRACEIDDKIQDYTVMNGTSYFPHNFASFLCKIMYANKDQSIVTSSSAKKLCLLGRTIIFSPLNICYPLHCVLMKNDDQISPKVAECLTNLQLLGTSNYGKKLGIRGSSWYLCFLA